MKKRIFSLVMAITLIATMGTTAFATEMSVEETYRDGASQISREAVEQILQKYTANRELNTAANIDEVSEEEISELFSDRSFAVLSGDTAAVERIDRELEAYGYYNLSDEDLEILFADDSTATPLSYGPPTKPGNTKYVDFKLQSGTTSAGYKYANIIATSRYAPADGVHEADSLPLYNCKKLNLYPTQTNYTKAFLKKSLELAAGEATSKLKTIPGILASKFAEIAIEDFFKTGQSFGASAYGVTSQVMVFSYLADVPDYYTHYVTAEQCNMLVVYYYAYNRNGVPDSDFAKNQASFTSKNFTAPQNQAVTNIKNSLYMKDGYTCGTIQLTYPTMENTTKTVTLSRQYYSELASIPGI